MSLNNSQQTVIKRLDTPAQTLVAISRKQATPEIIYWGQPLPENEDLLKLAQSQRLPWCQTMLDEISDVSLCPETGRAFPGMPGIAGSDASGHHWTGQFKLVDWQQNNSEWVISLSDLHANLDLKICIKAHPDSDMLALSSRLTNNDERAYRLDWLSCPVLPAPQYSDSFKGFYGRWCQEFRVQQVEWLKGAHVRENRLGRTSHEHFPGFVFPQNGATETRGNTWACHLGWSGDSKLVAEELPDGRRQIQMGVLLSPGEKVLAQGESFETPTLYASFSAEGENGVSWAFHRHCREHILSPPEWLAKRPVHYNCWEAIYFDHNLEDLKQIVDRAAENGAEMFVLDDGWFKNRNDDFAGLGDWFPDSDKYPNGLSPLISHVQAAGMRFGLWVEPEMVNLNSELYRLHPDWLLDIPEYQQVLGRNQHILDLTRPEVFNYLLTALDKLLNEYRIDYFKWDMNRSANLAANGQGMAVGHKQVEALYRLLAELNSRHPHLVIESCCSGGGRIDFGILQHTSRVWLSDSNDAIERWKMQRNASVFFPQEIIGSHVGPKQCHTSDRRLAMDFRAQVAAGRHMGFELDPREMDDTEATQLAHWCQWHKDHRALLHTGRQYRLEDNQSGLTAEVIVDQLSHHFILFACQHGMQNSAASQPLRLTGLKENQRYRVKLSNPENISANANRIYQSPLLSDQGLVLSGTALMQAGIYLPNAYPDTLWVIEGELLSS